MKLLAPSRERRSELHRRFHHVHREPLPVLHPEVGVRPLNRLRLLDVRSLLPQLLRRNPLPVVALLHQVRVHPSQVHHLRRRHQRGGAQREAVAAVHLPRAPELAVRLRELRDLFPTQTLRHARAREEP